MSKQTKNLILFFIATFAATWVSYFTIILKGWNPYSMPGMIFLLMGGSAPSWVGVLMVLFTYNKQQRRDYFRRCFSFRQIKLPFWAFIIFIFPLIYVTIIPLDVWMGSAIPGMTNLRAFLAAPLTIPLALFMSFLSGPWSEEFGWRGYSLDPLLKKFGILRGSALLGFIWGIWHLPLFLMPQTWHGEMGFKLAGFWTFMLYSIGLAMLMTWVYLRTNRSILSAFMMHLANNFTSNLIFPGSDKTGSHAYGDHPGGRPDPVHFHGTKDNAVSCISNRFTTSLEKIKFRRMDNMETTNKYSQPTTAPRDLQQVMKQHPLVSFFILAYAISWILSIPVILTEWGILQNEMIFTIFFTIKSFGPFLAAYIMIRMLEGKGGVRIWWGRIKQGRVGWQWYAITLLGFPAFGLLGIMVLPGALASFQGLPQHFLMTYLVSFILIAFAGGPLGEEPGWRGFALPRIQARYGALVGTLILSVLWTFWHLPDFLTSAERGGPGANLTTLLTVNLPIFLLMVMSLAVIFSWVFNRTKGSVFIAILLHTSLNTFGIVQPFFTAPSMVKTDLFMCIAAVTWAALILIFTRGRLGYLSGQELS